MMVFGSADDTVLQRIEARLDAIYRLIELQTRPQLEAAVRKLGTTKERRKAWILADGQRKTEDIARLSGNALRTVQVFVQEADRAGLMDASRRGYPRRRFEVIPSDWDGEISEVDKALEPAPSS
jgi:hypothetical protein